MPMLKSIFGLELARGAQAAAIYTMLMILPMAGATYWHFYLLNKFDENKDLAIQKIREADDSRRYAADYIYETMRIFIIQMAASYIVTSVLFLAGSICLLIGISKKNPRWLWPWFLVICFATGYFVCRYVYQGFIKRMMVVEEPIIGLILLFIMIILYIFVFSYRQQLLEENFNQHLRNQPNMMQQHQYAPPAYTAYSTIPPATVYPQSPPMYPNQNQSYEYKQ